MPVSATAPHCDDADYEHSSRDPSAVHRRSTWAVDLDTGGVRLLVNMMIAGYDGSSRVREASFWVPTA